MVDMTGSEQTSEFAPFDESGNIQPDSTRAESGSQPNRNGSEDFDKMNRGQDLITESEAGAD